MPCSAHRVRRVRRAGRVRRTRRLAPLVAMLLLAGGAAAAGCSDGGPDGLGGVRGRPGGAGLGDPLFPKLGNGGYDVRSYRLTLDYDPARRRIEGTAEITARATATLSSFNLDLHRLKASEVTVDGERAALNQAGDELTVRPREDLAEGAAFRAVVRYAGSPRTVTDADGSREGWLPTPGGALAVGEPAGSAAWFPGNHHPSDKASFEIAATVPEGLAAVSNGEPALVRNGKPAAERTADGRSTFVWRSAEPMATYLATLAIGPYELTARTVDGLRIVTAVDPQVSERLSPRIPEFTRWATGVFGPYPFSSAGAIVVRDGELGYALETQTRPVFPARSFTPLILIHEIAHQWYGNSVSPESWRDMWLNEGFATYAEWMWAREFTGVPLGTSFEQAYANRENWAFPPADPPSAAHISDPPVYGRGAMVLHMVRRAAGPAAFARLLKGWAREHRHGNASTADFTAYAEKVTGKDLGEVWRDWLYGEDKPPLP